MNERNWSDQTDTLGKDFGNWIIQQLRLPEPVLELLGQEYFGNTVLAYGFLAAALVAGWFLGLIVSLVVGRVIKLTLNRFSPKFAKGMARAVTGPLHLALLCWAGVMGTAFLAKPPAPLPAAAPASAVVVLVEEAAGARMPEPGVEAIESLPAGQAGEGPAVEVPPVAPVDGAATLLDRIPFSWKAHYAQVVLRGFFSFVMVLSLFWIAARVARYIWKNHVEPWVESSVKAPEKYYFPIVYRVLIFGWWFWALLSGIASLGFDSRESVGSVLSYSAAKNTIAEYLSFLGLVVLTILLARSLFTVVTKQVTRVVSQHGGERPVNLEETWFSRLERPVVYLISLLGVRMAAEVLNPNPGELLNIYGIVTTAIHLCITVNLVWIAFVIIDKIFEYFLFPIAKVSEVVDVQLLYLGRKIAKVGVAVIGFIFMIKSVGQDPGTLLAGLGIGGLAVSFAARDAISPFVAGISLYATRPFRMGDFIRLDERTEGIVEEIGVSATKLRKRDGTLLTIPNNNLTMTVVQNRTVNKRTNDQIPLSLHIDTTPQDRDRAMRLFLEAAGRREGVKDAGVRFMAYGNESIALVLTYWVEDATQLDRIHTALLLEIDERLREIGVRLSVPTVAHLFGSGAELMDRETLARQALEVREDLHPPGGA